MKNEVYYKQRQRAVSSHLAAVSSVQITLFDHLLSRPFGDEARSQTAPYALCSTLFSTLNPPRSRGAHSKLCRALHFMLHPA